MKYLITEEIESPTRLSKHVEAADFFFVFFYMAVTLAMGSLVHEYLRFLYYLFSFAVSIFLTSKSRYNVKRRNYESLYLMLRSDDRVYRAIYNEKE